MRLTKILLGKYSGITANVDEGLFISESLEDALNWYIMHNWPLNPSMFHAKKS
jgi:hypothetical protein